MAATRTFLFLSFSFTVAHSINMCGKPNLPMLSMDQQTGGRRIAGGNQARFGSHPWITLIEIRERLLVGPNRTRLMLSRCAGTLIRVSEKNETDIVITAAHCVYDGLKKIQRPVQITVIAGVHLVSATRKLPHQFSPVELINVVWHEEYVDDMKEKNNDIAILKLTKPIIFDYMVQPGCLPGPQDDVHYGTELIIAGWGLTAANGTKSDALMQVSVPVINFSSCQKRTDTKLNESTVICAGGDRMKPRDNCHGDSGGPAVEKQADHYVLQGVVCFSIGPCGQPGYPGGYTRVAYYIHWIMEKVRQYSAVYNENRGRGERGLQSGILYQHDHPIPVY